jgi:hypothetical protein
VRVPFRALINLIPVYHCGSDLGWSDMFYFQAKPGGTDWSPQLAVYGDLGNDNAQSLTRLQRETQEQFYDAIIHVGDFAYNMEDVCKYSIFREGHQILSNIKHYNYIFPFLGERTSWRRLYGRN